MKIKKGFKNRKGSYLISGIFVFMVFLMFSVFAWDTARVLYFKVYNQNLASVISISVVNASGHYYSDSTGKTTKGFLVTNHHFPNRKYPKGFTGTPADDPSFIKNLVSKHAPETNDYRIIKVDLNNNYTDYNRFVTGKNGIHGEARVTSTLEIDLFLSKIGSIFGGSVGSSTKRITNVATSIPIYVGTGTVQIDVGSIKSGTFKYSVKP